MQEACKDGFGSEQVTCRAYKDSGVAENNTRNTAVSPCSRRYRIGGSTQGKSGHTLLSSSFQIPTDIQLRSIISLVTMRCHQRFRRLSSKPMFSSSRQHYVQSMAIPRKSSRFVCSIGPRLHDSLVAECSRAAQPDRVGCKDPNSISRSEGHTSELK